MREEQGCNLREDVGEQVEAVASNSLRNQYLLKDGQLHRGKLQQPLLEVRVLYGDIRVVL